MISCDMACSAVGFFFILVLTIEQPVAVAREIAALTYTDAITARKGAFQSPECTGYESGAGAVIGQPRKMKKVLPSV